MNNNNCMGRSTPENLDGMQCDTLLILPNCRGVKRAPLEKRCKGINSSNMCVSKVIHIYSAVDSIRNSGKPQRRSEMHMYS